MYLFACVLCVPTLTYFDVCNAYIHAYIHANVLCTCMFCVCLCMYNKLYKLGRIYMHVMCVPARVFTLTLYELGQICMHHACMPAYMQ